MEQIKVFSPASVANLSCGFDVLGLALDSKGDDIMVKKIKRKEIILIHTDNYNLPLTVNENVSGKAAQAILDDLNLDFGFEITTHKNIHPGSGIGSSSSSATGTVFAINQLLGNILSEQQQLHYSLIGEHVASGSFHADNVAPSLLGGIILIRGYNPLDYIKLPVPSELWVSVITPKIQIKTYDARRVLKQKVMLKNAIQQCGNLAGLVAGFYRSDYELISRSLVDVLIEPQRAVLIPKFTDLKKKSIAAGALGTGISGSGPSVFSLCKGEENAKKISEVFNSIYKKTGIEYELIVSKVNEKGVKIIQE
ncbi:MAG: homoserine kinase [Solirubrobacteraceae bacterium]